MDRFVGTLLAFAFVVFNATPTFAAGFLPCFDHGNKGAEPAGAPRHYKIIAPTSSSRHPYLKAISKRQVAGTKVFRLIVEDTRFSSYKCWDKRKQLTGFDVEMLTEALANSGFETIEFVLRPWTNTTNVGFTYPSLLDDLNNGLGDAVSAGMSMNDEREKVATMVGPIYKAGKRLMARNDNPKISPALVAALAKVPQAGYESLRGLSVVVQASTIRAEFFHKLDQAYPGLVEFVQPDADATATTKVVVLEVDSATVEDLTNSHLKREIFGKTYDLVMVDTGSTNDLMAEGKLGVDTQLVTGNLSLDPQLGGVFGKGDGVSFKKNSPLLMTVGEELRKMVEAGRIDVLVKKWFKDDNSADHGWAAGCSGQLQKR